MINTKLLEPFNLHFQIHKFKRFYFISNITNLNETREKVDLNNWTVDEITNVIVSINEDFGFKIDYTFDPQTRILFLDWENFSLSDRNLLDSTCRLTIRFYSLAQQREKTLNQLFNNETE